jgi:hypothetical protein
MRCNIRQVFEFWDVLLKMNEENVFIRAGLESGNKKWMDKSIGLIDSGSAYWDD